VKTLILLALFIILAGCAGVQSLDSASLANASVACIQGAGWNGAPANMLFVGVDKGLSGTKGGIVSITCGAAIANFTDSGNLTVQSLRVPVEATPMKLTPR
jgi:hypothetical protein